MAVEERGGVREAGHAAPREPSELITEVEGARLAPLPREFYLRPAETVARDLLGRYLVLLRAAAPPLVARLVETEAYVGEHDRASHSWHGRTARTAPMYEEAGHAYMYFIYGMYWCLNVVTEAVGTPSAVLLRGAEPLAGIDGGTDGPGKLCRALGLDGSWNRADLTSSELRITAGVPVPDSATSVSARVGVAYAGEWATAPLRFFVTSSPHVSGRGRRAPRGRSPQHGGKGRSEADDAV